MKPCPNLSDNTLYTLSLVFMFRTKDFSHECEGKDVSSIVIQIWAPFMQRSISVVAFVLFMSPLGNTISPIAVSCVNQFVRQHFMKSGKCVK